jgi:hypothetical protein
MIAAVTQAKTRKATRTSPRDRNPHAKPIKVAVHPEGSWQSGIATDRQQI